MTAQTLLFQELQEKRECPVVRQYESDQQQLQLHFSYYRSPHIRLTEWRENMLNVARVNRE